MAMMSFFSCRYMNHDKFPCSCGVRPLRYVVIAAAVVEGNIVVKEVRVCLLRIFSFGCFRRLS